MKLWWLRDSRRFAEEKAAVEALGAAEPWLELGRWAFVDGNLAAIGMITAHGVSYPVQLIYPDQFPDVPAWVEPQDREAKWSSHQYGAGGTLCLELRPDNWVRTATGADVLRSAYNLLTIENPLGEGGAQVRAPSAHHIGQVQSYDWNAHPVLVSAGCRERLGNGAAVDVKALRWMAMDEIWPIVIYDEQDRSSARRLPAADVASWRFEIPVYLSGNAAPTDALSDRAALTGAAGLDTETNAEITGTSAALVLFTGSQELVAYHLVGTSGPHRRRVFVLPEESSARSGRSDQAMGKRVGVVGAGSVGSKIAESLMRSGVERLTLVDGDVMLPGNLERHVLDWRDVGFARRTESNVACLRSHPAPTSSSLIRISTGSVPHEPMPGRSKVSPTATSLWTRQETQRHRCSSDRWPPATVGPSSPSRFLKGASAHLSQAVCQIAIRLIRPPGPPSLRGATREENLRLRLRHEIMKPSRGMAHPWWLTTRR